MGDNWNKDQNELNGTTFSQESIQDDGAKVEGGQQNQEQTASKKEVPDSTYHWVNPKLQENTIQQQGAYQQQNMSQQQVVYPQPQTRQTYESYQFSSTEQETSKSKAKAANQPKSSNGLLKKFAITAALAVVFGLVSGVIFLGINSISNMGNDNQSSGKQIESTETTANVTKAKEESGEADTAATQTASTSSEYSVADVASNVMPSVVSISNAGVQQVEGFFGTEEYESESSGSGIIVGQNDTELLVATNNHVVAGAEEITISFIDDKEVKGQIKGTDGNNDLAVVAVKLADIPKETQDQIKVATLGNSEKLNVGEQVVAIGNALGYGQSVTSGYVSALNREVTVEDVTANLIQTDAAINPGNSGGALLNMKGELIGINAVKFSASGVEGMGYAIPIATAEPILGDLMNRETRDKVEGDKASYLGISCYPVTAESAQMYNLPKGVFVAEVSKGGAADKAGIKKGDIITKFGDAAVSTQEELINQREYYAAGEEVELIIQRSENGEYKEKKIKVTLDAKPADAQ